MDQIEIFTTLALGINSTLSSKDRYQRLLLEMNKIIPFDAACLFEKTGNSFTPLSALGLADEALSKTYAIEEHPRIKAISNSAGPIIFPLETRLPDPFDGLLASDAEALEKVHACLGCPLIVEDELIGILTADSLDPHAFDKIDKKMLKAITALAGATLRTSKLIEKLERQAELQNQISRDLMKSSFQRSGDIIGTSASIENLRKSIDIVAKSDFSVLITGETGTGKELVARAIHQSSLKNDKPLIYINCAALPESIAESELFGHTKGSIQGSSGERLGKFEVADGATIFLDEIGELPLSVQPKLLRVLQEGEFQKVGSDKIRKVNIRILAATNRDLLQETKEGRFRSDLFHRLNVFPLHVTPLRDHNEDIPLLIGYFADITRKRLGIGPVRFNEDSRQILKNYFWPGNVRELKNVVSRVILKASTQALNKHSALLITPEYLGDEFIAKSSIDNHIDPLIKNKLLGARKYLGIPLKDAVEEFQRQIILETVDDQKGNWSKSAQILGVDRSNLHNLAKKLSIK